MKDCDLAKYLRRNAVEAVGSGFSRAAVIPAYDEAEELPRTLTALALAAEKSDMPVAVIIVVNHPPGVSASASLAVLEYLDRRPADGITIFPLYAPELSGGVGAARKLGMDAFVAGCDAATIDRALLFSLDADTITEPEYFIRIEKFLSAHPEFTCCTVGFHHQPGENPETELAVRDYEDYLRSYVAGLREAGSPYAFMSIGSAFAVYGNAYVRAGGMKVRRAGEDFYFLQEAAKCGRIAELPDELVHPSARTSNRAPFGTGPAIKRLLAGERLNRIPPSAFQCLKLTLAAFRDSGFGGDLPRLLAGLPAEARAFLVAEKFAIVWPKILCNTPDSPSAREAAFHRWFDGLKTLRFLHCVSG